jgi:hypothetical protein
VLRKAGSKTPTKKTAAQKWRNLNKISLIMAISFLKCNREILSPSRCVQNFAQWENCWLELSVHNMIRVLIILFYLFIFQFCAVS